MPMHDLANAMMGKTRRPRNLVPFDPAIHSPRQNEDGTQSTEMKVTVERDGITSLIPSLYFDASGNPVDVGNLSTREIADLADDYERASGLQFPRFGSEGEANTYADKRQQQGGAFKVPLAQSSEERERRKKAEEIRFMMTGHGQETFKPFMKRMGEDSLIGRLVGDVAGAFKDFGGAVKGEKTLWQDYGTDPEKGSDYRTSDAAAAMGFNMEAAAAAGAVLPMARTLPKSFSRGGDAMFARANDPRAAAPVAGAKALGGLPMDPASRMGRAAEQGYGPKEWYHGTKGDFDQFDPKRIGQGHEESIGHHFTDRPGEAATYAGDGSVVPARLKFENPLEIKTNEPAASIAADRHRGYIMEQLAKAERAGKPHDGVVITSPTGQNAIALKPENIRSPFARFDPDQSESANILAANPGRAGVTVAGAKAAGAVDLFGNPITTGPPAPPFYSQAKKVAENIPQAKMTAAQWTGFMRKQGVRPEEFEYLGMERFFKENPNPTQDEVVRFIDGGRLEIEDVILGGTGRELIFPPERFPKLWTEGMEHPTEHLLRANAPEPRPFPGQDEMDSIFNDISNIQTNGKDYGELITRMRELKDEKISFGLEQKLDDMDRPKRADYIGPHFEEQDKNILAHFRHSEQVIPNSGGKRRLNMEEAQSDIHQAAQKEGYAQEQYTLMHKDRPLQAGKGFKTREEAEAFLADPDTLDAKNYSILKTTGQGLPDMPLKKQKAWAGAVMHRLVKKAADEGYDEITWPPGSVQNERSNLEKHIQALVYDPDRKTLLTKLKNGEWAPQQNVTDARTLEDYVGKETARKLLATERTAKSTGNLGVSGKMHRLDGLDLKTGGEFMRNLYDSLLPKLAKRIGKKYGAVVDTVEIGERKFRATDEVGVLIGDDINESDLARRLADHNEIWSTSVSTEMVKDNKYWRMKITPELAEAARSEGFATFANRGRAGVAVAGAKAAGGAKKIVGAPAGVTSPQKERALRQSYLDLAEEGAEGRLWYDEAGKSNLEHMGDDRLLAQKYTGAQAVTSASTGVEANLGHAIRGHNQKMAGQPMAETGRYPAELGRRIDAIYDSSNPASVIDTLKTGPYGENIMKGGGFAETPRNRGVHDIWDGRNWGYKNPDGSPFSGSFGSTEHRWMDGQMDKAIKEANERNLGGHSDWNERSLQAATWIAGKAKTEGKTIAEASRSYPDYYKMRYGQGSYESVPGRTTTHLPRLAKEPISTRNEHMDEVFNAMTDRQDRDLLSLGFGAPTGPSFRGPGIFEGQINPGAQTQVALGRATGGGAIDPASADLMNAMESARGALLGQDAAAWHLGGAKGSTVRKTGMLDFELGGGISDDAFKAVADRAGESSAVIPTEAGFRLLNFGEDATNFNSVGKDIARSMGIDAPTRREMIGGNLIENDWRTNPLGQKYMEHIDRPEFVAAFDRAAPDIAKALHDLDQPLAKQFGRGAGEVQKLRMIIANEGYAGLMKAIRNGAATIGAVGLMLEVMPSSSGGTAPAAG